MVIKWFALFLSSLCSGMTANAEVTVGANTVVNLKVDEPTQLIRINYPGHISDVCGLKFSTSLDLPFWDEQKSLADEIVVSQERNASGRPWEVINVEFDDAHYYSALTYILPFQDLFVGMVKIETVSGQSLKSVIDNIFGTRDFLILFSTVPCQ